MSRAESRVRISFCSRRVTSARRPPPALSSQTARAVSPRQSRPACRCTVSVEATLRKSSRLRERTRCFTACSSFPIWWRAAHERRLRRSVVFDARDRLFGGLAGVGVDPVGDADLGFGFLEGLARLVVTALGRLQLCDRFLQRRERARLLAACLVLPVE